MQVIRGYVDYGRRYVEVGLPILLTSLSPIFMAVADNVMVGYLGEEVRAAAAFVNVMTATAFVLLIGISSVLMPLVAGAVVAGNYEKATRALRYGVWVSVLCGVVCVGVLGVVGFFLDRMGQDAEVIRLARGGYFQIITASVLLNSVSQPLKRYLDGLGFRYVNTGLSLLSAGVNVGLNYVLIEGRWGCPRWGLNGAGVATFVSRLVILGVYVGMVGGLRRGGYIVSGGVGWSQRSFMKMLKLGLPSGFELGMKMLYLNVVHVMIGWMGVVEQASASILFTMVRIGLMLPIAMGTAGSIVLAEVFRRGPRGDIERVRLVGYGLTVGLMCWIGVGLMWGFPWMLDSVFVPEEGVRGLVMRLLPLVVVFQTMDGLTFVGTGLLRGLRDTFVPFLVTTFVSFCVGLPMSYYLAFYRGRGLGGIFEGVMVGLVCSAVLLYMRFSGRSRVLMG